MTLNEEFDSNLAQVGSDFAAIKDKIIACGVEVANGTPTYQLRNKVTEVYNKGKQDEYDAFWGVYQLGYRYANGNYQYAFAGQGWTADIFKPKYDIKPIRCDYMFASTDGLLNLDLPEHLSSLGIVLDISKAINVAYMFTYSYFSRTGVLNVSKANTLTAMFMNSKIPTIDKLILSSEGNQTFDSAFRGCPYLENIIIEGVIGKRITFNDCTKLTKASITSIVNALSTDTSDLVLTLSQAAVNKAFESSPGANDGSTANNNEGTVEWQTLKATKSNWIYSLV